MIDREYYPLAMAAKILECSEDDLIHFAATQKIQIHILTDGQTYARDYDSYELLQAVMLVNYEYFIGIESNVHPAPSLSLVIQDIDNKYYGKNYYGSFHDGVVHDNKTLNNFVILHSELMKLKKPVEQNVLAPKEVSEREESTYLNIIGGLLELMLSESREGKKRSVYINQSAISSALLANYSHKAGISERTLDSKFAKANRSIMQE